MPTEYERERCPFCGYPASVAYKRSRDEMNEIVRESRSDIRCSSAVCTGAGANRAAARIARKAIVYL